VSYADRNVRFTAGRNVRLSCGLQMPRTSRIGLNGEKRGGSAPAPPEFIALADPGGMPPSGLLEPISPSCCRVVSHPVRTRHAAREAPWPTPGSVCCTSATPGTGHFYLP
jgi:hypothetical protein